ncbi:PREDICTED: eukaryotic translation initiation factor 3 subunit H-like [Priapulus caudatus]|uniref:Eukaryotic translation initiation factor 3 subunit H n=1 Tax=Priapulus caudatus TaxID=37621 RepID=A0ABM1F152_PRICU|nr:PREDICTED: eukaryotic translation initiation factor 3 subunit H-like [Priapulus caudatus]
MEKRRWRARVRVAIDCANMASGRGSRRTTETESVIACVQLDGLVILKIIKHCEEVGSELSQGVLLGLLIGNCLEITNCFPFPRNALDDPEFDEVQYQMEMMRHLRYVNIDHLHVGWYQSTFFGGFVSKALLDSQFQYQHSIEESVVLVYDPLRTTQGYLSLKAYRLTPQTMAIYETMDFSPENIKQTKMAFSTIFEEVPIFIKNSHLVNGLTLEVEDSSSEPTETYNFLDLATSSVLEKNLKLLMDTVDELCQDSNKFHNHFRQAMKQNQAKQQHVQKRHQENAIRTAKGEPPLPEEDINKLFKPLPAPHRLDSLLQSGQVKSYCDQINQFSCQGLGKMFLAEALQDSKKQSTGSI